MSIKQSAWAKGNKLPVRPQTAGAVHAQRFTYDFGVEGAVAETDILELAVIPPYADVVDAMLVKEGTVGATGTLDVGVMTGTFGDKDDATRTVGAELFDDANIASATVLRASAAAGLLLGTSPNERAIGVKFSAAQAKTAGNRLHLVLFYKH